MERRKWFLLIILACLCFSSKAQPGFNNNVEDAPIDGGLSVLIAAGVGYGAKKTARSTDRAAKRYSGR
jgi:hypothetical protein